MEISEIVQESPFFYILSHRMPSYRLKGNNVKRVSQTISITKVDCRSAIGYVSRLYRRDSPCYEEVCDPTLARRSLSFYQKDLRERTEDMKDEHSGRRQNAGQPRGRAPPPQPAEQCQQLSLPDPASSIHVIHYYCPSFLLISMTLLSSPHSLPSYHLEGCKTAGYANDPGQPPQVGQP